MDYLLGIPVYNEKDNIPVVFRKLLSGLPDAIKEILVINDGSTDGSGEILEEIKNTYSNHKITIIHNYPNQGYGRSIRFLLEYARSRNYEFLITMDCDQQHRIEDLHHFIEIAPNYDVVSGSRYLPGSPRFGIRPPADRVEINKRITEKLNTLFRLPLTDSFCGFKRYRLKNINPDVLDENGYAFPVEFWVYVYYHNLSVTEIPVARVYITDDRSFGENLDRPKLRYHYYLRVLKKSIEKFKEKKLLPEM